MQNIPGIAIKEATEQIPVMKISPANKGDQNALFADLFNEHATMVENELALTPVSSKDKMLESAPDTDEHKETVNAAGTKAPVQEEPEPEVDHRESLMTKEDFEEVKDDLEAYGMTEKEIADIEKKINSDEGMTWGQFTSVVAHKMAELRTNQLSDEQKEKLNTFFAKFGFTPKESEKLIKHLENGNQDKVMKALQAKVDAMPQGQQLLFDKQEIEAFTTALSFSKEFTSKIQELFGTNTLPKDVKEAFTLMRQEMVKMDSKDRELVRAVTKGFVKAMGDTAKESTLARQVAEAVDLKPRVAEEQIKADVSENFKDASHVRKDALADAKVRSHSERNMAEKVEIKTDAKPDAKTDTPEQQNTESNKHWTELLSKTSDDGSRPIENKTQIKTGDAAQALKAGLTVSTETGTATKTQAWEKVSAPKVMTQVDNAFIKTLNNGGKQLTLQLTPENLGKLSIVLQVNGKEVSASIRAESPEAAKIINENIDIIKNSLENQGLKVEKLDVQTGLANNQEARDWFGQEQHNMSRDRDAMAAMRNHMKNMRSGDGGPLAQDLQLLREQAINAAHGLHVIA
nr:flagellar hook-length control protein FliK [uncultured Pseudodesulfovibrio sp.]